MTITTQYNPNAELNRLLIDNGCSKTVYALVTPETEAAKIHVFGSEHRRDFMSQFREAWTGKQDAYHREFFDEWHAWSSPVVEIDRTLYPFCYPTAGASEPLRQIIFEQATRGGNAVHVFEGEYEGYKAMAEAAGLAVIEHPRDKWREVVHAVVGCDLFFISQPSAIDGNVWHDFNEFINTMPVNSVVADVTYVGAVPETAVREPFDLNNSAISAIVFSLSKPFGAYYDRIGGVFMREQNAGLYGNVWFKSLTALSLGRELMRRHHVFDIPTRYAAAQAEVAKTASTTLGFAVTPSDVFILATGEPHPSDPMGDYLSRAGRARLCLTPRMADIIGTTGEFASVEDAR